VVSKSGWVPWGFQFCVGHMERISPKLIEQTISVFKSRTGRKISKEGARQAVWNISGFFRVLEEWADAEGNDWCDERRDGSSGSEGVEQ
jgi:hypothetical protein